MTTEPTTADAFAGRWQNQNQSEMDLTVAADGTLSGAYRTAVGRPGSTEEFALAGFVNGDRIVFCVSFGEYGSLGAWTGKLTTDASGETAIHTLWHLGREHDGEDSTALWESILAGASQFRRVP